MTSYKKRPEEWKKKFIFMWTGQSVSVLTSAIIQMSLVWYLTTKTGSTTVMAVAMFMGFIPRAIIGPFAGVIVDRFSKKKVMIYADLFIALMSMVPVIYGFFNELPVWIIMLTLFCRSLGSAFHLPALQAVTPLIVPEESLTQYAGFAHGFESAAHIISPALAAVLFSFLNLNIIIMLDVFGALFAVFMLRFVIIEDIYGDKGSKHIRYISELKESIEIVRKEPMVVLVIAISCIYAIIYSPIGSYYPLITMNHFGGSVGASALVETVVSIGTLCGAFTLGLIGKKIKKERVFIISILVYGGGLLVTGVIPVDWFVVFVIVSAFVGFSTPFYSGIRTAIIQTKFSPEYLGRIFALTTSLISFVTPIGLVLAGLFAEKIGVANWFFCSGIACVVLAVVSFIAKAFVQTKKGSE